MLEETKITGDHVANITGRNFALDSAAGDPIHRGNSYLMVSYDADEFQPVVGGQSRQVAVYLVAADAEKEQ
ncbi:uncharacterized protein PpBr36_09490 [Pyricularia pennisetigena]|uniref:uncharacterized protein n=1 Tax=Pyricularia pennisetigena TaxID=1578925 RepID=UPI00114DCD07|nr:uncharacterized protein PpBr36_09490 [Pyricularia pennisetigena]TLS21949.1 hypothetical protein PpBr36_09490 [Pyricularia pennisetigena]